MSKLTPKQEKFCNLYIELGIQADAYRGAFDTSNMSDQVIYNKASDLMKDDEIRVRVAELKKQTAQAHGIDRAFIINGLLEIISDADYTFKLGKDNELSKNDSKAFYRLMNQTKNTDKLRALETLTKMLGLNEPDKVEIKDTTYTTKWG